MRDALLTEYRQRLRSTVALDADAETWAEVHAHLAGQQEAVGSQASIKTRLDGLAPGLQHDELDDQGFLCLPSVPPVRRSELIPKPWLTNPLRRRWWKGAGTADVPVKGGKTGWQRVGSWRRILMLTFMLLQAVVATWYMKSLLPYQSWSLVDVEMLQQPIAVTLKLVLPYALQLGILILFLTLFLWISVGFWTALMGFWKLLAGQDRYHLSSADAGDGPIDKKARTAIIMPIANEDVARVFAGLRATVESVARESDRETFDFFILSDTSDADIAMAEQQAWLALCQATDGFGKIFYRRRRRRVKRKSGNIDDFCRRWGSQYRYMVVMDADSVMTGHCLCRLVRLMESHPKAGIIQTAPRASGMQTLYARMQQFATRVYGPLFTAGLYFWQLGESHYWGHNAIIRIQPFIRHCALAPLPGRGSFSGAILSHDFVEAALMRRAGWSVWIAYDLDGSYEELPPNLLDELKRDRRWCHGNLMNFRLFMAKGMHPVHRAVFLTGVMSYLSAPLWFLFLLLSTALLAVHQLMEMPYFLVPNQLFPVWPQWQPDKAVVLFSSTLGLLFLPKVLAVILIACKNAEPFGGRSKVVLSMLWEMLFSVCLAPVRMLFHTRFVLSAFLGWAVQWHSPQREDDATPWSEAIRRHAPQTLLGLGWATLVGWLNPNFLWWLSPIVAPLILSIPISVITSRTSLGQWARRKNLFLIPEEYSPPQELLATERYCQENRQKVLRRGFIQAVVDPLWNALACAMAPIRHRPVAPVEAARQRMIDRALTCGPYDLDAPTRLAILSDPSTLSRLHDAVWCGSHAAWLSPWKASAAEDKTFASVLPEAAAPSEAATQ